MTTFTRDRNLLFGAVAWRAGLLRRSGVSELLASGASDNDDASELAVAHGLLKPEECRAIEAVVACHLAAHNNDAVLCLEALSAAEVDAPSQSTQALRVDMSAQTARVADSNDFIQATTAGSAVTLDLHVGAPLIAPERKTIDPRYRLVRPHAGGGLGMVWLALDRELDRQVAVKEMKGTCSEDGRSRARFLREAEVTGKLEHPGIVPIYSLGTHPDGRPYYAMRFIEGESLKEAIVRHHQNERATHGRNAGLCALLGHFAAVCQAIGYAHSRGVMHRDLKPSNVMLGSFGETLVVDWGLAKAAGANWGARPGRGGVDLSGAETQVAAAADADGATEEAPTARGPVRLSIASPDNEVTEAGAILGTRFYMSPEQARGELDQLGPATDIYGLGAILFTILTGKMPQDQQAGERSPRALAPRLSRSLDAVCQKAMAARPEDRYETATALADDVQRWLRDEAVTACPEPFADRAWRLLRRHRALAATSAAALLIVASTFAWAYSRERANTAELTRLNQSLAAEKAQTEEARRVANVRLDRAMIALRDTVAEAATALGTQRRRAIAQGRLFAGPRRFFQTLVQDLEGRANQDARARVLVAEGRLGLGRIDELLGELPGARQQYETAISSLSEIGAGDRHAARDSERLAELHEHLGNVLTALGEPTSAAEAFRQAIRHQQASTSGEPSSTDARSILDRHHAGLGAALRSAGMVRDAARTARERLALWPRLDGSALARAALEIAECAEVLPSGDVEERDLRSEYAREAFILMQQAIQAAGMGGVVPASSDAVNPEHTLMLVRQWLDARWPAQVFAP